MTVLLPDLIILDHQIQGMSALSVSSLLASHFPATKLLLFTEEDSAQLREACLTCGVQVIISKRTLRADMAAAVEQICGFTDRGLQASRTRRLGQQAPPPVCESELRDKSSSLTHRRSRRFCANSSLTLFTILNESRAKEIAVTPFCLYRGLTGPSCDLRFRRSESHCGAVQWSS